MITAEQKLLRMGKLGSSDAAAVMGLDPFRSASDVFLVKTGQADDFAGNENTDRGNLLEPALIRWASNVLDRPVVESRMFTHSSGLLVANLDAHIARADSDCQEIIEAKTTVDPEGWGEDGTDEIPDRVLVQVHHQFVCIPSARIAWVPVLLPGYMKFDFRLYRVERNDELVAEVERAGLEFMENHVLRGVPPKEFLPSREVLKRVRRQPNKVVPVADELVERYQHACQHVKDANEEKEQAQCSLLATMGDAEGATYSGGAVTYLEIHRRAYEVKASTYRQLRIKSDKK